MNEKEQLQLADLESYEIEENNCLSEKFPQSLKYKTAEFADNSSQSQNDDLLNAKVEQLEKLELNNVKIKRSRNSTCIMKDDNSTSHLISYA